MTRKKSTRFVIDACVVRAAGTADKPVSSACREFLLQVLRICHRVALSPEISEEWKRHRSRFSRRWRLSMEARKKVVQMNPGIHAPLRACIRAAMLNPADQREVEKDAPLVEAALLADQIVVSIDDVARAHFRGLAAHTGLLHAVRWVNPVEDSEGLLAWMNRRAPAGRGWRLGQAT